MKIISLEVKDNKRFSKHHELRHFVFTPDQTINILLGGNGAGKSSLVSLLSPWPFELSDLKKGGYVVLTLKHKGIVYTITSRQGKGPYSFVKGSDELNPTHRVTIQQQLVTEHLGITKEIHEVLTNPEEVKFTTMSPMERRKWFIYLSDSDYEYVLGKYQRAMDEKRKNKVVLKHEENKLSQLLADQQHSDLDYPRLIKDGYGEIDTLLEKKVHVDSTIPDISNELSKIDTDLPQVTRQLIIHQQRCDGLDMDSIETSLYQDKETLASVKALAHNVRERMDVHHHSIVVSTDLPPLDELLKSQDTLVALINNNKIDNCIIAEKDREGTLKALNDNINAMGAITKDMPVYDGSVHSKDVISNTEIKVTELTDLLNGTQTSITQAIEQEKGLVHLEDSSHIECPECKHQFRQGYDPKLHASTKKRIKILGHKLADYEQAMAEVVAIHTTAVEYQANLRAIVSILEIPDMSPIKQHFIDKDMIRKSPGQIADACTSFINKLTALVLVDRYQHRLSEISKQIEIYNEIDIAKHEAKSKALKVLETELQTRMDRSRAIQARIDGYTSQLRNLNEYMRLGEEVSDLTSRRCTLLDNLTSLKKQLEISDRIRTKRIEVTKLEQIYHGIKTIASEIQQKKSDVAERQVLQEEWDETVKTLSPVTGLLAMDLLGFISAFVTNMNTYLGKLWTYPLVIQSPTMGSGKLDVNYRFPLVVGDNDPVKDIRMGSTAMKEVIDLVFRLSLMHHVGMDNYPLFLDELGAAFDSSHREQLVGYINNIVASMNFSNLFIVSHYASLYSVFNQFGTDYTVLSTIGVDMDGIPDGNDCIVLK